LLFRNCARRITLDAPIGTSIAAERAAALGYSAMDLLHALLNLADAISTAVGVTAFWYAWVRPAGPRALRLPASASAPEELERFLRAAALNNTSGQGIA
jgi:hypothetical protein